jgi:hypothetical protein
MIKHCLFDRGETRDQIGTARFDQHVLQSGADQCVIVRVQAREEQGQGFRLRHEIADRVGRAQAFAGDAGFDDEVRMHQQRVQSLRHWQAHKTIMRGQHQAAEQARRDVVAVTPATRGKFTFERVRIQVVERQRCIEQRVRGDQRGHGRCRRSTHAGTQRNTLLDLQRDAELRIDGGQQRRDGARRRVLLDLARQFDRQAADGIDAHAAIGASRGGHPIARSFERVPDQVEADRAVADAGRRKRDGTSATHTRAPR